MRRIAALDIFLNGMALFMALAFLMLPFLNPPTRAAQAQPPGNLIVSITWPEGDQDVDLWVWGPAEPVPVGYSNKGGIVWNLLRDDLGKYPDATPLNYESSYTRGLVPGRYWINVHCYRCTAFPIVVDVEVAVSRHAGERGGKSGVKTAFVATVELARKRQELTVVSFEMDENGTIDRSSMNNVFKPLRAANKG